MPAPRSMESFLIRRQLALAWRLGAVFDFKKKIASPEAHGEIREAFGQPRRVTRRSTPRAGVLPRFLAGCRPRAQLYASHTPFRQTPLHTLRGRRFHSTVGTSQIVFLYRRTSGPCFTLGKLRKSFFETQERCTCSRTAGFPDDAFHVRSGISPVQIAGVQQKDDVRVLLNRSRLSEIGNPGLSLAFFA